MPVFGPYFECVADYRSQRFLALPFAMVAAGGLLMHIHSRVMVGHPRTITELLSIRTSSIVGFMSHFFCGAHALVCEISNGSK